MMKGLAIFLVVMGHILTMCVRDIDRAPVFKFIGQIHMPLFFFISGWLAVKTADGGTLCTPSLVSRAKRLLLPMLGASTLWIYYYPCSGLQSPFDSTWSGLWLNEWKNGYWFTLVLFEIFAVYAAVTFVMRRSRSMWADIAVSAIAWAVVGLVNMAIPAEVSAATSLGLVFTFFPIFMAGVVARRHADGFMRLCALSWAVTVSLLVIVVCMALVCWPWRYAFVSDTVFVAVQILLQLALVVVAVAVVKPWSEAAFAPERPRPARLASMWAYLGDKSLAIYLLHYFFLFPMSFVRPLLESFDLAPTPLVVFSVLCAIPVVALSLCADYVLSFSKPMCMFLTGSRPAAGSRQ